MQLTTTTSELSSDVDREQEEQDSYDYRNEQEAERVDGERAAHTPLPWRVGGHPGDSSGTSWRQILADTQPYGPAFVGTALEADARLIARAVNAHAQLVAALEDELEAIRVWQSARGIPAEVRNGLQISTEKIRTALKHARG
jgi:hypothetical protein